MKTLAIFVLALFAVVMAQNKVNVVDNNPILPNADSAFYRPSAPNPNGYQQQPTGAGGDYRKEWAANHNAPPYARGGK